jgi:hypothetical protein
MSLPGRRDAWTYSKRREVGVGSPRIETEMLTGDGFAEAYTLVSSEEGLGDGGTYGDP